MSLNLIDLIKGQLGPALVSQAATNLGESESAVSKAISGFLPAVVGGLANHSDDAAVVESISGTSAADYLGNLTGGTAENSTVSRVLHSIFKDKISTLTNSVATYAGINNSSSASLLNMVTGAALASLSNYATENNLGAAETKDLLRDQQGTVSSLLPAGLSLASLGLGNWGAREDRDALETGTTPEINDDGPVEVTRAGETHVTVKEENSIWKWLLPLLLLALAGWFLMKQCDKNPQEQSTTTTTVAEDSAVTAVPADSVTMTDRSDADIDLNGTTLRGYKGGMEDSMIAFLKAGSYENAADDAALKDNWYTFDKVNFKMASANELEAGSMEQLENLLSILKAYPEAKIKIGGYTDKVGDQAANITLSQQRADFIKNWLTEKGVGSQVIGAEGYGSKFADVAETASDAERAADRKMAVRFAK